MQTHYFYSATLGFLAGILLPFLNIPSTPVAGLALLLAFTSLLLLWLQEDTSKGIIVLVILLLAVATGSLRAGADIGGADEMVFDSLIEESVVARGVVTDMPEESSSGQNITVTLTEVSNLSTNTTITGESRAVAYVGMFPEIQYGDALRLEGELRKPTVFETDNGRLFDYPQYLAKEDVYYELSQPEVGIMDSGAANPVLVWMAVLRQDLLMAIDRHIPDPHAALTGGVLLGAADTLGDSVEESFRDTGIVHVVVLSGYHVTVVAVAIGAILSFLGLSLLSSTVLSGIGVIFFALLVGFTSTVVRASIMAVIALVARIFSRQYAATRGLMIAVVGMVVVNPYILLYDPSFQLSVIATAGLVAFGDVVYGWLSAIPHQFGIREMATATITAQIAVSPLLIYYTGTLSLVSLFANLLILPVIPVLMSAGAATSLIGMFFQNLALPFAGVAYAVAEYIFSIVNWLTSLPFSTASIGNTSLLIVFLTYIILVGGFIALQNRSETVSDENDLKTSKI